MKSVLRKKAQRLDELEAIKEELYDILMAGKRLTIGQVLRDREDELLLKKETLEKQLEE